MTMIRPLGANLLKNTTNDLYFVQHFLLPESTIETHSPIKGIIIQFQSVEYKKRISRPGTSTNIQRYCTFWNRFVVICTLRNRFYEQVLVFLPTVFVNENIASTCEDYSEFSDEELPNSPFHGS